MLAKDNIAYEPLLDLLVQFARDVQSEFYPYFKELFPVLVGMCNCQDVDLIQVGARCMKVETDTCLICKRSELDHVDTSLLFSVCLQLSHTC